MVRRNFVIGTLFIIVKFALWLWDPPNPKSKGFWIPKNQYRHGFWIPKTIKGSLGESPNSMTAGLWAPIRLWVFGMGHLRH